MKINKYLISSLIVTILLGLNLPYTIGEPNHGLVSLLGDELVFEYGKTIKIGDNYKDAIKVLEESRFSCKEISIKPKFVLHCNSYMAEGVYGGEQTVIQLIIENNKVTAFE